MCTALCVLWLPFVLARVRSWCVACATENMRQNPTEVNSFLILKTCLLGSDAEVYPAFRRISLFHHQGVDWGGRLIPDYRTLLRPHHRENFILFRCQVLCYKNYERSSTLFFFYLSWSTMKMEYVISSETSTGVYHLRHLIFQSVGLQINVFRMFNYAPRHESLCRNGGVAPHTL